MIIFLAAAGLVEQLATPGFPPDQRLKTAAFVLSAVLPLLAVWRFPLLVLGVISAVVFTSVEAQANVGSAGRIGLLFAMFMAVDAGRGLARYVAIALTVGTLTWSIKPWESPVSTWLYAYVLIAAVVGAGIAQAQRRSIARSLETNILDLTAQAATRRSLTLHQVRTDLARELHNIVGIALESMTAKANSAITDLQQATDRSLPDSIEATEAAGRYALSEMRRLLTVLRNGGVAERQQRSQPGLSELQDLVSSSCADPDSRSVKIEGDPKRVPASVGLATFRIVEEVLSTAHDDRSSSVSVSVSIGDRSLALAIESSGAPLQGIASGDLQMMGVRERTAVFGGTLQVARSRDVFAVEVDLPFPTKDAMLGNPLGDRPPGGTSNGQKGLRKGANALRRAVGRTWIWDIAFVAALSAGAWAEFGPAHQTVAGLEDVPPNAFSTGAKLWAVAIVAMLLVRRVSPFAVVVAVSALAFLQNVQGFFTPISNVFALQIAVFTVGSANHKRWQLFLAPVLAGVGLFFPQPLTISYAASLVIFALSMAGAGYLGTVVGDRRKLNKQLQERLASIDEERRLELSLALRQERLRVAREMHDLVAHSLSLMVVQAGAARAVSRKDPNKALEAMRSVVETGKQVVVELRQLISLLSVDEPSAAAQLPGADIPTLLERARRDGIDVTFQEEGSQRPPSGGSVELSTYRIIQEALTNARKHAPGARVDVSIRYQPQSVELKIEDEGAAQDVTLSSFGTGLGLAGMRERVAMFGGELRAEPSSSGGFVVEASMPWSAAA